MGKTCQIVKLLTDGSSMFSFFIFKHILNQRMVGIKHQGFSHSAEHAHIHSAHVVHLHHILHSSCFFGYGDHGCNACILHLFNLDIQLIII